MSTRNSSFGTFDHGAQYFTVRDPRFAAALGTTPEVCKPWSANTVRVLDSHGLVAQAGLPAREPHWVPVPGMRSLVQAWAQPLLDAGRVHLETRVTSIEPDAIYPEQSQLRTVGEGDTVHVYSGFDVVVLAIPCGQARQLLAGTPSAATLTECMANVSIAPCWTLMLAYPNAVQPGVTTLGPHWNAARSLHHRIAWVARESSKPQRGAVERWTVQASAAWSQEHLQDEPSRVKAKMIKAFAEITGIRVEPAHADLHRWLYAQTEKPLGVSHLFDATAGIGVCGDWCIGHRVEDAFVSGLEMALALV
jgi:predicted NAD/FAD-dependent oxidoreductase